MAHEAAEPQIEKDEKTKLLIVDDNDTAESAALLLTAWNHDIRVAHTGPQALQVAPDYEPDVILLDIGLPEMNGYEVVKRLRQDSRFKRTLIIALPGYGQESDRQRARDAGFDEHLTKPVNLEKLEPFLRDRHRRETPEEICPKPKEAPCDVLPSRSS